MIETILLIAVVLLTFVYYKLRYHYGYFDRHGIICPKAFFPYGNVKKVDVKESIATIHKKLYSETKREAPLFGMFMYTNRTIVPTDLDLIKNILIKDYQYFDDREILALSSFSFLSYHLLTVQRWKSLRQNLSIIFTSEKIKFMFSTLVEVSKEFESTMKTVIVDNPVIEMKELLARYTTDVIGVCVFGIKSNNLQDPNTVFHQIYQEVSSTMKQSTLVRYLEEQHPKFMSFFSNRGIIDSFIQTVRESVEHDDENKIHRYDFLHLLIQMQGDKQMEGASFDVIASQLFLLFLSGIQYSSTTVCSTLFELAHYTKIQEKLRDEILFILDRHNNELTYEAVQEMTYLEQVLKETLRMHPPATYLKRHTLKDYPVVNTNIVIEKGMDIWIPVYAIQTDPDIYQEPDIFDPERFDPSMMKSRHSSAFLSFGGSHRNCVSEELGMMQTKVAIITLIKNFRLHKSLLYEYPMKVSSTAPNHTIAGGLWLRLESIE